MKKLLSLIAFAFIFVMNSQAQPFGDTTPLRNYINANIVPNGTKSITATMLNNILNGILNTYPLLYNNPAGGQLSGTYPNPTVNWSSGNSTYDARYVPLTRTLTGGFGVNTIGSLSANRTITIDTFAIDTRAMGKKRTDSLAALLSSYTPTTRTITINGTAQTLEADITFNVGTVTSVAGGYGLNGGTITFSGTHSVDTTAIQKKISAGTDISISGNTIYNTSGLNSVMGRDSTSTHSININLTDQASAYPVMTLRGSNPIEVHSNYANGLRMYTHADADFRAPYLYFFKSMGTEASPHPVHMTGYEENSFGGINFGGWNGSTYKVSAAILTQADGDWSSTNNGGHISIYYSNPGNTVTVRQMAQFGGLDATGQIDSTGSTNNVIVFGGLTWSGNRSSNAGLFHTGGSGGGDTAYLSLQRGDQSSYATLKAGNIYSNGVKVPMTVQGKTANNSGDIFLDTAASVGSTAFSTRGLSQKLIDSMIAVNNARYLALTGGTVSGATTFSNTVTAAGIITTGSAPTLTVAAGAGTGASASISGNSTDGIITLNTGTGTILALNLLLTFNFSSALASTNYAVTFTPANGGSAGQNSGTRGIWAGNKSTSAFDISTGLSLTASTTYLFSYHIGQWQ